VRIRPVLLCILAGPFWLAGCLSGGSILNPDLVPTLTGNEQVASLPGNAPAVVIAFENQTTKAAFADVSIRFGDNEVETVSYSLVGAGFRLASAYPCPVSQVTVGDVSDPSVGGVGIYLAGTGNQGQTDTFTRVEPFGIILQEGATFECGDEITFALVPTNATPSGYRILAFIESGS
jgi:hypothetical protein